MPAQRNVERARPGPQALCARSRTRGRSFVGLERDSTGAQATRLTHCRLKQGLVDLLLLGSVGCDRQLIQTGEQAAQSNLIAQGEARDTNDPPVDLRDSNEKMRVRQRLAIGLGKGDGLGEVADILKQGQDREAVLERRGPNMDTHDFLLAWSERHGSVAVAPRTCGA